MRIALCDDSPQDRAAVKEILGGMGLTAEVFDTGEALQAAFWKQPCDIVLLDIEMPGIGGYELALVLKKQNAACEIVFITDHTELVLDAFQFKPAAFVPKRLLKSELPKALRRILERGIKNPVFVTKKKGTRIVELNQVMYLKYVYDHEVEFTLKDGGRFSESGSMKQFEAELSKEGFIRVYSNCMVNALYITRLERDAVVLANGEQFPVARERRESVRNAYMEYLMQC
ncbi:MAG: LytTR family DNA-binding domain-containing protein [Lachnospiraceae bacterium]|nr:LytTR family DNA-binding domain-containing protein [Lachnospiraceae bacterium]